jgi:hypothetical protein
MLVLACDPGLTGACAVLDQNGLRAVFDLPTMPIPDIGPTAKVRTKIDARALVATLRQHCTAADGKPTTVIEAVGTMGGKNNAVQTQGSLLRTLGAIETVLEVLGWAPAYASPQTWKRHFGLLDSELKPTARKAKAMQCARRLYPGCNEIARAKDHNRAESILIAHWWRATRA